MLRTGADPTGGGAPYPLKAPAVCVVGPTASGKTDLAQALALELDGEVISADSMQIYRGMDIGTGKLPASERLVPHHGFDLVDPGEPFSAALFQNYARDRFRAIDARVDAMVETGLVAEVEGLLDRGFREGVTAPQAIGYKEIVEALDGFISLDEAVERIKLATRRYAKRQRTWFRKDARIRWLDATSRDIPSLVEEALELLDDGVA